MPGDFANSASMFLQHFNFARIIQIDESNVIFTGHKYKKIEAVIRSITDSDATARVLPLGSIATDLTAAFLVLVTSPSIVLASLGYRLTSESTLPESQQSSFLELRVESVKER
jgi:hypothetical protein